MCLRSVALPRRRSNAATRGAATRGPSSAPSSCTGTKSTHAAAGPPYPPELIETMEDFDELRAYAAEDDGTLNVEEAFAFLGIGAQSSSDDDTYDDSD